jgi:cell division protein FtsI (penicillin-binding protein 3)
MSNTKRDIKFRVYIAFRCMVLFALAILGRAIALQVVSGARLRALSAEQNTRIRTLEPERGNIYTADGAILSITLPEFTLKLDYTNIAKDTFEKYVDTISIALSNILKDRTTSEYETLLRTGFNKKAKYYALKNKVQYNDYLKISKLPIFRLGANKGGLIAESTVKRINPFGLLANRMVGIYRKNAQKVGLEGKYDEYLAGEEGERIEQKIAGGVWMPLDGSEIDSKNGMDIVTTIDLTTQEIAENALLKTLQDNEAAFGTCIVMETKTGAIKALANLGRQKDGTYIEDYNYALQPTEPGSTFKINSLLSAIDDGFVTLDTKVDCGGGVGYFGKQRMADAHRGMGSVTVKEAFAKSSNVGCAKLIYNNYLKQPTRYLQHLKELQLQYPTGVDLSGEISPRFSMGDKMTIKNPASLAWLAIGYEVKVSPLRTCMTYNAVANNGKLMKPYIVSEIKEYGQTVMKYQPRILNAQIAKSSTIAQLKDAAYAVVEEGTGKALKNEFYSVCGKTGTALVADKGISYDDHVYHGSFVGFFPKEDPLYTICVLVRTRKGASSYYGGQIALPVFKVIADRLWAKSTKQHEPIQNETSTAAAKINNGIKSTSAVKLASLNSKLKIIRNMPGAGIWMNAITTDSLGIAQFGTQTLANNLMPDVSGMGLTDAMHVLQARGMRVHATGKGKVNYQSIVAGQPIKKGDIIKIQLG